MTDTLVAAYLVWANNQVAIEMVVRAVATINKAYEENSMFFNGKKPRCVLGGLFCLLNYRYGKDMKQRKIAHALGTTDVSIRDVAPRLQKEHRQQMVAPKQMDTIHD
jgi:N-acetylglucosamine kinase-like BadF-type ATPase